ncbi:tetratricopeptide repeat protein [Dethiobacter alkaliphilus]|nr:tetratricopeptide repeat protein [Dethiobacter alkaliphilus]MCW3490213.1 tetratricopeptide repeat protein [Dethiobacter alkaliphilus]
MSECEHEVMQALPEVAKLYLKHGQEALAKEETDVAIELFEKVLKVHPNLSFVSRQLGDAYLINGNSGKAVRIFKKLVSQEPGNARLLSRLAHAYSSRGWYNKATTCFNQALALDKGDLSLWLGLVGCLADAGDYATARTVAVSGLEAGSKTGLDLYPLYAFLVASDIPYERVNEQEKYLPAMKEWALQNEAEIERVARFFASLGEKVQKKGWYLEAADLLTAACELLPDDQALCQARDEFLGHNRVNLLLEKLECDPVVSDHLVEMLRFEQEMCGKIECPDCGVTQFFFEMDVIIELDPFRREIAHLKSCFPELYALKKSFFDSVLDPKKEQELHERYQKKFKKYSSLYPERFSFDDGDEWDEPVQETFVRSEPKIGRNEPCPCGSGKKYKKCCGK